MTNLDRLAIALWRAHATALHKAMHGASAAADMVLTDAGFDKQYGPMKTAWREGVKGLLLELKGIVPTEFPSHEMIDAVITGNDVFCPMTGTSSFLSVPSAPEPIGLQPVVVEPVIDGPKDSANPTGIPGGAHIA